MSKCVCTAFFLFAFVGREKSVKLVESLLAKGKTLKDAKGVQIGARKLHKPLTTCNKFINCRAYPCDRVVSVTQGW